MSYDFHDAHLPISDDAQSSFPSFPGVACRAYRKAQSLPPLQSQGDLGRPPAVAFAVVLGVVLSLVGIAVYVGLKLHIGMP